MTDQNNLQINTVSNSRLKAVVMTRVHAIRVLQMLLTTTTLSIAAFVLSLWGIGREVWVARVLQDEPTITLAHFTLGNVFNLVQFYLSAFVDTRFVVQVLTLAALVAFLWSIYSLARMVAIYLKEMQLPQFA